MNLNNYQENAKMTKAEERARETYPGEEVGNIMILREGYKTGYSHALQDLKLTWEDIPALIDLTCKTLRTFVYAGKADVSLEVLYKEVLRRFNDAKNK